MNILGRLGGLLLLFAFWLGGLGLAGAEVAVPTLKARVTDLTGTLSAAPREALEHELTVLEQQTGAQLAVLMVASTAPESIEQYALRVAENWKLGRTGHDDGVLLIVAKDDRKLRIEVGYGLEGTIPDAVAKRVIEETIVPRFKQGDFAGGVTAGVQRLAGLIEGRAGAPAAPEREDSIREPLMLDSVRDLTGSLSPDRVAALAHRLVEFYNNGHPLPAFVLVVPGTGDEPLATYAQRVLALWGERENLDTDRSVLLVVALDKRHAHVAAGLGLSERLEARAGERLADEVVAPLLQKGDVEAALDAGVAGIEKLVAYAVANKPIEERLAENFGEFPIPLLLGLVVVGTLLRWLMGPLLGGLSMGGMVGTATWWMTGALDLAFIVGGATLIFVLVGVANWLSIAVSSGSGSGSSSSSGGFSGGGGSFGGGGASGSW